MLNVPQEVLKQTQHIQAHKADSIGLQSDSTSVTFMGSLENSTVQSRERKRQILFLFYYENNFPL